MPTTRIRKANQDVAAFFRRALQDSDNMSIEDLGRATGLGRTVGAIVRGETQRPSPEQASRIASQLRGVTVADILKAYGYDVWIKQRDPDVRLHPSLARLLRRLTWDQQAHLVDLVEMLANAKDDR